MGRVRGSWAGLVLLLAAAPLAAQQGGAAGRAFELERKSPQAPCTRQHASGLHAFECLTVRPRERDGRIAGNPRRELVTFEQGHFGEASLDALVHVAQAFFESEHFFANHGEAEMTGFDDAGVHRADGNLVNAFASDTYERIVVDGE